MSRLESIKERCKYLSDVTIEVESDKNTVYIGPRRVATWHDAQTLERLEQLLSKDTGYLLQLVQRYETTLQKITHTTTHMQAKFFAQEALKGGN